jgi:hypothetical protein
MQKKLPNSEAAIGWLWSKILLRAGYMLRVRLALRASEDERARQEILSAAAPAAALENFEMPFAISS